jgi:anti-sigma regulatory factor (Ser/Thr protein kinase)
MSFIRGALAADEAVLIAVTADKADALRSALGADATRVSFIDMATVGRNPACIIPAWRDWVDEHLGRRPFRGIGEPIWAGRTPPEIAECQQHESLLNVAFAGGPPWWLLCPYDAGALGTDILDEAARSHPCVLEGTTHRVSPGYQIPSTSTLFGGALPPPAGVPVEIAFAAGGMSHLRRAVDRHATAAGLTGVRVKELVLAVNELAANSIDHGGGKGTLRMWLDAGVLVCEVRDRGHISEPLAGRERPGANQIGGCGLWIVNRLCDLVQIRSSLRSGTVVRVHMALPVG